MAMNRTLTATNGTKKLVRCHPTKEGNWFFLSLDWSKEDQPILYGYHSKYHYDWRPIDLTIIKKTNPALYHIVCKMAGYEVL